MTDFRTRSTTASLRSILCKCPIYRMGIYFLVATLCGLQWMFAVEPTASEDLDNGRKYPQRIYQTTRIQGASPVIDGDVTEDCWKQGKWDGGYLQREPLEAAEPSDQTEMKILYDDDAIYVAIRAFVKDVPNRDKQIARRDQFSGDMVGIAFDSYFDRRTAFEFDVSGGGSKVDILAHPDGFDMSWNAVWDVAVGEEENAWVAEYRIPFSQLRFPKGVKNRIWGLHSWRWHRAENMESNWQIIPRDNSGFVYQFGELHGLENIQSKRQIEVMPYVSGNYKTHPKEKGNPFRNGSENNLDSGLDAKIGITSNFIVDLTINPDFGQVEADPSQLNLSTIETFFQEQRPFFLEGKSLFEYEVEGDLVFYSRRIGKRPSRNPDTDGFSSTPAGTRILGATKLTGKTEGGFSLGGLFAVASKEEASIFDNNNYRSETAEPKTQYFVTRASQELNDGGTSVGGILTGTFRELDEDTNLIPQEAITGGFDASHRWLNRTHFVRASWMGSKVSGSQEAIEKLQRNNLHNFDRPDADHLQVDPSLEYLTGWGGNIEIGKDNGGHWHYETELDFRSPELELNDIGFLKSTDRIRQKSEIKYIENEPGNWYKNYRVSLRQRNNYLTDGTHTSSELRLKGSLKSKKNWNYNGRVSVNSKTLNTKRLRGGPALKRPGYATANINIRSDGSKDFAYWLTMHSDQVLEGDGAFKGIWPGFQIKRGSRFTFNYNIGYFESDFDFQWVGSESYDDARETSYFVGKLDRRTFENTLRFDFNFTPEMSLTYYGNLYLTSGNYSDFKLITNPRANRIENSYYGFQTGDWIRTDNDQLELTRPNHTYHIEDPDFNYRSFRSNLIFKWEYKPGSTLYIVWSQDRENSQLDRLASIGSDFDHILDAKTNNIFLVKASYWFSI